MQDTNTGINGKQFRGQGPVLFARLNLDINRRQFRGQGPVLLAGHKHLHKWQAISRTGSCAVCKIQPLQTSTASFSCQCRCQRGGGGGAVAPPPTTKTSYHCAWQGSVTGRQLKHHTADHQDIRLPCLKIILTVPKHHSAVLENARYGRG